MTDKLRARDWRVERVEHRLVRQFMTAQHYAGGAGNTSVFAHGLVPAVGGELHGAAVWLPPMRPAAQYVAHHLGVDVDRVLCLSRLAVHPDVPTNGASFLMGRAIRDIRRDGRWDALVTWADTRLGHTGAIYRATNWAYMGTTRPRRLWVDSSGRLMSTRAGPPHARRNLTKAECEARGWVQTAPSWKHRFVMRLR